MDEKVLLDKIAHNVIQGRVEAGDEGVEEGLEGQPAVTELVTEAVEQGIDPKTIVLKGLTTPMEDVGKKFEKGDYLIPDMLAAMFGFAALRVDRYQNAPVVLREIHRDSAAQPQARPAMACRALGPPAASPVRLRRTAYFQ